MAQTPAEKREKAAAYARKWRSDNAEHLRAYERGRSKKRRADPARERASARRYQRRHRYAQYGTSEAEVVERFAAQAERCAVCAKPLRLVFDGDGRAPDCAHVDHCHKRSRLRGILCARCNGAIGALGDNAAGLRHALAYLERFEAVHDVKERA